MTVRIQYAKALAGILVSANLACLAIGVLLAPYERRSGCKDAAVVWLEPDGSERTPFGTNGTLTRDFGGDVMVAQSVTVRGDGRLPVGDSTHANTTADGFITRIDLAGGTLCFDNYRSRAG